MHRRNNAKHINYLRTDKRHRLSKGTQGQLLPESLKFAVGFLKRLIYINVDVPRFWGIGLGSWAEAGFRSFEWFEGSTVSDLVLLIVVCRAREGVVVCLVGEIVRWLHSHSPEARNPTPEILMHCESIKT